MPLYPLYDVYPDDDVELFPACLQGGFFPFLQGTALQPHCVAFLKNSLVGQLDAACLHRVTDQFQELAVEVADAV